MSLLHAGRIVGGVQARARSRCIATTPIPSLQWTQQQSTIRSVHCRSAQPSSEQSTSAPGDAADPVIDADAAAVVGAAWDPEGLFSKATTPLASGGQLGDLIARRERERAARLAAAAGATPSPSVPASTVAAPSQPESAAYTSPSTSGPTAASAPPVTLPLPKGVRPLRPLPQPWATAAASGVGVPPSELPPDLASELDALLREQYIPVDLYGTPGLRVVHLDPPVLTVDGFLSYEECDRMVAAAETSGRMVASRIGAGNVSSMYGNASSSRRTSSGMMVTPGVAGPDMDAVVAALQARGKKMLRADEGPVWGFNGLLPKSGQYCYEVIQVARYDRGQHFLAHEDGFPPDIAAANAFQRHATLLVYLNTCQQGGATRFNYLDLAVRPTKGTAVLFFPAFADGVSDVRSLHTAEDAVDTKYVTQQWIARGMPKAALRAPAAAAGAAAVGAGAAAGGVASAVSAREAQVEALEKARKKAAEGGKGGKGGKGAGKGAGKGFGAKPCK